MPWVVIVGVVRNVKHNRLDESPDLQVYEPFAQRSAWSNYLVVRSTLRPDALIPLIRAEVAALDRALPMYEVRTMREAVSTSLGLRRLMNGLLAGFSAVALVLASIGIYGVISVGVNAREREFGIRMALGARARNVRLDVMRRGLWLAASGVSLGIGGAIYLTRFLQRLLFGVAPIDWLTFSVVALVLTATGALAAYFPARRATRADPVLALRAE
jgi:ABC-type antimicrobial peptide transport system permease subunit